VDAKTRGRIKELNDIIQVAVLAISKERASREFYLGVAERASGDFSKQLFTELAHDEERHEARLRAIIKVMEKELSQLQGSSDA